MSIFSPDTAVACTNEVGPEVSRDVHQEEKTSHNEILWIHLPFVLQEITFWPTAILPQPFSDWVKSQQKKQNPLSFRDIGSMVNRSMASFLGEPLKGLLLDQMRF